MTLEADQAVQEASFAGACLDQHAGRPAPSLGWPGKQGYGLVPGLGAGASRALRARKPPPFFVVLKKSPGGRQAKGWETAETAAAEVGAWREAGTGYPPYPPSPALQNPPPTRPPRSADFGKLPNKGCGGHLK